jgi:hypothetical protein
VQTHEYDGVGNVEGSTMKTLLLSLVGVVPFATLSTPATAHDSCDRPYYGYQRSHGRVYYAERPDYYRYYDRGYYTPPYRQVSYDNRRCESHTHKHHGLHGVIELLFGK